MVKKTTSKKDSKAKAEPVKPEPVEEETVETEEETVESAEGCMDLPDFGSIMETALPLLKGLMPQQQPAQPKEEAEFHCPCDDQCEVHIVGSEEMILKLFGKA